MAYAFIGELAIATFITLTLLPVPYCFCCRGRIVMFDVDTLEI